MSMNIRHTAEQLVDAEVLLAVSGKPELAEIANKVITDEQWIAAVGLQIAEEVPFDEAMAAVERNSTAIIAARRRGFSGGEVAEHALMTLAPKRGRN